MKASKPINDIPFFSFEDQLSLNEALSERIKIALCYDIERSDEACLAVSGGRTPRALFSALSTKNIEWHKVLITLTDERWVANNHTDSNEKLVTDYLLQNQAKSATLLPLKNSATTPFAGEQSLRKQLLQLPDLFTLCLLGLGEDGHCASLFPNAQQLAQALDMQSGNPCQAMSTEYIPHLRMSLTLPRLLASRLIIVHFTGEKKRQVYEHALQAGPIEALPIRSVLTQQQTPVAVYWAP